MIMALNWRQVPGNFNDRLFEILKQLEAPKQQDRFNIHLVDGNPTIGIGFDLKKGGKEVQRAVFVALGLSNAAVNASMDRTSPPAAGTPERREYDYVEQLRGLTSGANNAAAFNAVMQQRAANADPVYVAFMAQQAPRPEFVNDFETPECLNLVCNRMVFC